MSVANQKSELDQLKDQLEVEAALERVRARAMRLHRSDELKEVIAILYGELIQLGLALYDANIVIQDKTTKDLAITKDLIIIKITIIIIIMVIKIIMIIIITIPKKNQDSEEITTITKEDIIIITKEIITKEDTITKEIIK